MSPSADDLSQLVDSCRYMDVHTHCDQYEAESSLYRTLEGSRILNISSGMDPASSGKTFSMGKQCRWIIPCFGIHPWMAGQYGEKDVLSHRKDYKNSLIISEIGLDTVWAGENVSQDCQIPLLKAQLKLAEEFDKPVTLHTKGAEREILTILSELTLSSVLIHWYDGPEDVQKSLLAYGCYFTVPPVILKDPAYGNRILKIPSDRLLPETDNPGTWPWLFQREGSPGQIREIYNAYSQLCGRDIEEIQKQFQKTLKCFLRL